MQEKRRSIVICFRNLADAKLKIEGIYRYAVRKDGWSVIPIAEPRSPKALLGVVRTFKPDGFISGRLSFPPSVLRQAFGRAWSVLIDVLNQPNLIRCYDATVSCDDTAIGACAATLLVKRGLRNVAYVGIRKPSETESLSSDYEHSKLRESGFATAAAKHPAVTIHPSLLMEETEQALSYDAIEKWLLSLPKPCGVAVYNDIHARTVLAIAGKAKIPTPDALSVISVDNDVCQCENCRPTISSIEPDFSDGGYKAAQTLDLLMGGKSVPASCASYGIARVVERDSTKSRIGQINRLQKITDTVRELALTGVSIREIAYQLNMSPRMLELTYRKAKGTSARTELTRLRLATARELLQQSDKPFAVIAKACGFKTTNALCALFKRQTGVSLRAFRESRRQPHLNAEAT